jgi:hypothetical protein
MNFILTSVSKVLLITGNTRAIGVELQQQMYNYTHSISVIAVFDKYVLIPIYMLTTYLCNLVYNNYTFMQLKPLRGIRRSPFGLDKTTSSVYYAPLGLSHFQNQFFSSLYNVLNLPTNIL